MPRSGCIRFAALGGLLLFVPASAPAAVNLPGGATLRQVDFERHVMGVLGRAGCNSGSCHGSFQGKNGFRLSLFGYEPAKDYLALTRDQQGRRLDGADPDNSLLLLKASGQLPHGGGRRFDKSSWQYRLLREWIAAGALRQPGSGDVEALRVTPAEHPFGKPGEAVQLHVLARFRGGDEEDVTPLCDFRSNDDAVAEVSPLGQVQALRAGDTAVVVSYRGNVRPVRVLVPRAVPAGFVYPAVPEANFIDREVFAKLRRLNIVPSDLSGDAEFLRRVTIDTTGSLPSPDEVRAFLADPAPDKRLRKIDELLAHPLHAALWATRFCDITGNNTDLLEPPNELKVKRSQMWHDWFRERVARNVPYDEIVRGVLTATSRDGLAPEEWVRQARQIDEEARKGFQTSYKDRASLDLFWQRQQRVPPEQWGERTAAAFLGVRLECAQCHKHPFDRWTQADYRAWANLFTQVVLGESPEAKKVIDEANAERNKDLKPGMKPVVYFRELWVAAPGKGMLTDPDTGRPLPSQALGGPVLRVERGQDLRVALFEWMRRPDNPYFARSFVNRVWAHYLGVGLVMPVDGFSLANPPSNAPLLDALAQDFVTHGYDIRRLERSILGSRTYQLSSAVNDTNRHDRNNYSHGYVRPLLAEVVVDVLNAALGTSESWKADAPPGVHAIEVGASRVQQNPTAAYLFRIFGRSPRQQACDCERAPEPALPQKLFLMTDAALLGKLQAPTGRLAQLLKGQRGDDEVLEELFLATLGRPPSEADRQLFAAYRARHPDRRAAFTDTLWALLNTREFIFNH